MRLLWGFPAACDGPGSLQFTWIIQITILYLMARLYLQYMCLFLPGQVADRGGGATFQLQISSILSSISSISCPKQETKGPLSAGCAQCHWEVKAGRIRKGQEQGSQIQGNKGKPIPPGIILILETQGSLDSRSMGLSGEDEEGGGVLSRILPQRKCAMLCPNYPKVVEDPVSCSDFSLNVHLSVLAVCPRHTYQERGFRNGITDYNDIDGQ